MENALPVVICLIRRENQILLIKRNRGAYVGLWGLPGGKIEKNEHLSGAACREILEETTLSCTFDKFLGTVSELYYEDAQLKNHFLLHVCELSTTDFEVTSQEEGEVDWIDLNTLDQMQEQIILSDYQIIRFFTQKEMPSRYVECKIVRNQGVYEIKKFEAL